MDKMGLMTIPDIKTDYGILFNNNNNNKSLDYEFREQILVNAFWK
jgi:hypothetical protein